MFDNIEKAIRSLKIINELFTKLRSIGDKYFRKSWYPWWITTKINDYLELNLSKIQPPKINDYIIYHYTPPSGLRGIIEKHEIWASNVADMNDSREFYEALDIIDEFANEMRFSLNTLQFIESMMREKIQDSQAISQQLTEDLVKQAIEASIKKVGTTEEKERKLRSKIKFQENEIEATVPNIHHVFSTLQSTMQLLIEESRKKLSVDRDDTEQYEIRERNGIFFPYVELKMPSKKDEKPNPLPIKEIYLSPRTPEEFERAKIGLQYLLKKNGHKLKEEDNVSGIEIKPSSIPLRI